MGPRRPSRPGRRASTAPRRLRRPGRTVTELAGRASKSACRNRTSSPARAASSRARATATGEKSTPVTIPTRQATPPSPAPKPTPDPIVGLWPVRTLTQARELQDSVDAGHQPWLLSAESVSTAYAQGELGLFGSYVEQVGPAAYQVRSITASGRPPCIWPSRCATATACGS
jgi:hypothetical protein